MRRAAFTAAGVAVALCASLAALTGCGRDGESPAGDSIGAADLYGSATPSATADQGDAGWAPREPSATDPDYGVPYGKRGDLYPDPNEQLELTASQQHEVDLASYLVTKSCMERAGFTYAAAEPADPAEAEAGVPPITYGDAVVGLVDRRAAEAAGYRTPAYVDAWYAARQPSEAAVAAETPEGYDAALYGGADGSGGCQAEAADRLAVATPQAPAEWGSPSTEAQAAPEVAAALADWSACMAESGYDYASPADARDDPRWFADDAGPDATAGPEEIKAAVTDIDCKDRTGLIGLYRAAVWRVEQDEAARNQPFLDEVAQANAALVARAQDIIAELG
jgi:hypothetical protein